MTAYTIIPDTSIDADSLTDVALLTALRDNAIAIGEGDSTVPAAARFGFGKFLAFTTIVSTNASWAPNAATKKIVVLLVGGGSAGGGANSTGKYGFGGKAGSITVDTSTSVSGTYAITIGAGGAGITDNHGNAGGNTTITGTGLSPVAKGGIAAGLRNAAATSLNIIEQEALGFGEAHVGNSVVGVPVNNYTGGSASNNSGAGGGGVFNASSTFAGGNGGSGIAYIWEYS